MKLEFYPHKLSISQVLSHNFNFDASMKSATIFFKE